MANHTLTENVAAAVLSLDDVKDALTEAGITMTNVPATGYGDKVREAASGGGGGTQPTLHAPTISRSGNNISVSNPSSNGSFATGFKIYDGNTLIDTRAAQDHFYLTWLGVGSYSLSCTIYGTNFNESAKSNVINASVYTVARSLTNLTTDDNTSLISDGETYSLTLTPASGYYLPSSISVSMGGTATSSFTYNATTGVVSIPNVSGNVSVTAAASLTPPVVAYPIYGVSGLYSSSPALTRTDDAVGMSYVINSSSGAIVSDFDNVFPWSEAEIVTLDAGKFLRLPTMFFRVGTDSNNRITDVAVSKAASGSGNWYEIAGFDVACYGASINGTQLKSVTGATLGANQTRDTFRTYAANSGTGCYQYDFCHQSALWFLWLIEWATKDSASVMTGRINGSGTSGGNTVRPSGGTDGLSTSSGFETAYAQMRWHYIEDFFGNLAKFYDGIISTASGSPSYVTTDPSKFSDTDTTNMSALSFNNAVTSDSKHCIAALGWDADHPFFLVPIETVNNGSYDTYFCDYYFCAADRPVVNGGASYYSASALYGAFQVIAYDATTANGIIGSRLLHSS
jgi:hypothetical protein